MGYTFTDPASVEDWITNPLHIGWMIAGRDEDRNPLYMRDCFEGIISQEEFEEYYIQIKGEDLSGEPVERVQYKTRFTRKYPTGLSRTLLNQLFISEYTIAPQTNINGVNYYECKTRRRQPGTRSEHTYARKVLWTLPANPIDSEVVDRLREIAEHDKQMAGRVEKYYNQLAGSRATETNLIQNDIAVIERQIAHLQMLMTTPGMGFSPQQLASFGRDQQKGYYELEKAQRKMNSQNELQPTKVIPNFYRILGKAPGEFWELDIDRQRKMLRLLLESVQIEHIAPHVYTVCLKWIQPVSIRPDIALVYRGSSLQSDWSPEEEAWIRANYPTGDKLEILQHFPERTWGVIKKRATDLGLKRSVPRYRGALLHIDLAYNDWIKTCEYSEIDYSSEEGLQVLDQLNHYANEVGRKEAAFHWLLPADKIAASTIAAEAIGADDTCMLEKVWPAQWSASMCQSTR